MNLSQDEIIENFGKKCGHYNRNTFLPYEYELTCIACGFNSTKRKHEFSKVQDKIFIFIIRLK